MPEDEQAAEMARLRARLAELTEAYTASVDPDSLLEMFGVVYDLAGLSGVSLGALEEIRAAKEAARGGFSRRIVWLGNEPRPGR
jgi:predicted house-cleaning noncanonical NTP pyrophosphatase (MazG superfamily)